MLNQLKEQRRMCAEGIQFCRDHDQLPDPNAFRVLADLDRKIALMEGKVVLNSSADVSGDLPPERPSGNGSGARRPAQGASEAQLRFVRKLVATKDPGNVAIPADLDSLSKSAASALIDRLVDRPNKDGSVPGDPRFASEKQIAFLRSLIAERDWAGVVRGVEIDTENLDPTTLSSSVASAVIETLKSAPRKQTSYPAKIELADGFYLFEGTYYLVQHAVHGSGHQYAKRWIPAEDGGEGYFEIAGGLVRKLRPEHALSEQDAERFGQVYGRCGRCGRTLTDKNVSMKVGIGPECRKRV